MNNDTPHLPPFCWRAWKAPVLVLVLLFFGTLAWTYHLVKEHNVLGMIAADTPAHVANAQQVALGIPPSGERSAVVNIGGILKTPSPGMASYVSVGAGVLVSPMGYVVTAQHLIQDLAEIQIRVQTDQGPRQYSAKTVKVVPEHNLALLKIVSKDRFPFLALENKLVQVGEVVRAWGDPMGTDAMQRLGAVTQLNLNNPMQILNRKFTHLIQTNAVVHWSQSGGPLINGNGRLVGINLAVEDPRFGVVGYAVPAQVLMTHFQELVSFPKGISPATPVERPADRWWKRMKGVMQPGLGLNAAIPPALDPVRDLAHEPTTRILGYPLASFFGLLLLGFVSGISGGMMTMGGGIIKVTGLMWFFGYGLLLVRPVAYITNIFMYGAATLRYRQDGLLRFDLCRPLIPWAMGGMVLGYFIGNVLSTTIIQWLLGGFALILAIKMLVEISESRIQSELENEDHTSDSQFIHRIQYYLGAHDLPPGEEISPTKLHGLLGLPMGLISGILGITGGVIEVPLQRYLAKMPLRNAIANSATLVFFASLVGSVVALFHGTQIGSFEWQTPVVMAIILTPGAWVGGRVGAWLTAVVPLNTLRWVYAVLMFVIALRMFIL
ncbi:putative membrane transporter protein [Gammaproteobacteria bacterium]